MVKVADGMRMISSPSFELLWRVVAGTDVAAAVPMARAWASPAAIAITHTKPETCPGVYLGIRSKVPSPNSPLLFSPRPHRAVSLQC